MKDNRVVSNLRQRTTTPCPKTPLPAPPLLIIILTAILSSCSQTPVTQTELALGTFCSVTLYENGRDDVFNSVFERIREIENLMSVRIPASDISRINSAAGIEPVRVQLEVLQIIYNSLVFAFLTDGAFDPSIGPLVNLWGINSDNPRVPSHQEIEDALSLLGYDDVDLFSDGEEKHTVFLARQGMALDLGAIAKGYAADVVAKIIIDAGINRAIINLGGNIVVIGEKEDKSPWAVGIQNPRGNQGDYLGIIRINPANYYNQNYEQFYTSVVTSGIYERYFEEDGKMYHHIFSPFTGYPADNELSSVTIISSNSMTADALSTAVFVLGYEKGRELLESLDDIEAVFVFKDGSVRFTDGVDFVF